MTQNDYDNLPDGCINPKGSAMVCGSSQCKCCLSKEDKIDLINSAPKAQAPPKAFPYFPPVPSEDSFIRNELMMDLNKWDNNDKAIAKRCAKSLIELLSDQFGIEIVIK